VSTDRDRKLLLSRRGFLRGLGVCLALPAFESVFSRALMASPLGAGSLATTPTGAPLRMGCVYFPNGVDLRHWWPTSGEGTDFELNRTMKPFEPVRQHIQIIRGMDQRNAAAGHDGFGDHARANATFLTAARARKTDSIDIHLGVSIDQEIARHTGHLTRFSSLELSCDGVRKTGRCDSGYSCAYQYNLSWKTPTTPAAPEPNPRLVFERLFGTGAGAERQAAFHQRQEAQKSILDFILDETHSLRGKLGVRDQQRLDENLTVVREIEQRIERAEQFGDLPDPGVDVPAGIPANYGEHMEIMYDMLALAFQTDSTRVASLLLAGDGSNRSFAQIGIPEGHHDLSHHQKKEEKLDKIAEIDSYYVRYFVRFLDKLSQLKDIDGNSVLHNSMILYGSGIDDGDAHSHTNLPLILAGSGGGSLNPGRYTRVRSVPMANLFMGMADRFGVTNLERFGDSTGKFTTI
jgi:hypothetical protein